MKVLDKGKLKTFMQKDALNMNIIFLSGIAK
jgi:hypothetical protein